MSNKKTAKKAPDMSFPWWWGLCGEHARMRAHLRRLKKRELQAAPVVAALVLDPAAFDVIPF